MFAGINVCVFETRPCSWGLIFAVSSGLGNYLGTYELCLLVFMFAILKRSQNSPNKSLTNINEFTVYIDSMRHIYGALCPITHCIMTALICVGTIQ